MAIRTADVARLAGVSLRTLYYWLKDGRIPEPERSPKGYRMWTPQDVAAAIAIGPMGAKALQRGGRFQKKSEAMPVDGPATPEEES